MSSKKYHVNLNTSNVNVNRIRKYSLNNFSNYLNTSNVNVNLEDFIKATSISEEFKYIQC